MVDALRGEGVGSTLFSIEVIEHVVLGIDILACSLQGSLVVVLIDEHVGLHGSGIVAYRNHIGCCVLGPDGAPVLTAHIGGLGERVGLGVVLIVVQCYSIIGNQDDSRTLAYCLDGRPCFCSGVCIVDLDDIGAGVSIKVDDGVVKVGFGEVVGRLCVGQLPRTHGECVIGVANLQLQVSTLIDVDKDITCLVAAIPVHVMLDGFRTEGLVAAGRELEVRVFSTIDIHGEVSSLGEPTGLPCTEVVYLIVGKTVMYLFRVALDDGLYGLYLGEVCEMAKLLTYKYLGICG